MALDRKRPSLTGTSCRRSHAEQQQKPPVLIGEEQYLQEQDLSISQIKTAPQSCCQDNPHSRVHGWVNNVPEWMAAADLLLSKPGASSVNDAINGGLPLVDFASQPGNERRLCDYIEKWQVGRWAREPEDISAIVYDLLSSPEDRRRFRKNAQAMALPRAAYAGAEAILECWHNSQARG